MSLFLRDEGLVILIPEARCQVEIELTKNMNKGSRVLNEYLRKLVYPASKEKIPMIGNFTKQTVDQLTPLIDLRAGWVIAFSNSKKISEQENN